MRGRPPKLDEARGHFLRVRMAPIELERLDLMRGSTTRSDFVREILDDSAKQRGIR